MGTQAFGFWEVYFAPELGLFFLGGGVNFAQAVRVLVIFDKNM